MIYLDSAATSMQKPASVPEAAFRATRTMASPGRGGHEPAMRAADTVFRCRCALAEMLGADEPEQVVFTMNATHALNIAIGSMVSPGDRVVVSGFEHNAVTRALRLFGAEIVVARSPLFEPEAAVRAFSRSIPGAKLVVCTHVSNVFGYILPIQEIAGLCAEYGVPLIVDASQSAGVLPVDAAGLNAAFVAMPGHKGLLGPQGTGVLVCRAPAKPLMAGGTGSESRNQDMPETLPDRLEAGTHNVAGIAGLLAGTKYVSARGTGRIEVHERRLMRMMAGELSAVPGLTVYASPDPGCQSGVLSVRHNGVDCEELAAELGRRGVAVRAGLHCAPFAHETAGTLQTGTVRYSFSPFNTESEIRSAANITKAAIAALK